MNNPNNPLIPQGSMSDQKNQGRARVKIAVFVVLAVHGVGLLALLMAGCRKDQGQPGVPEVTDIQPGGIDTNQTPVFVDPTNAVDTMVVGDTNLAIGTNLQGGMETAIDTNVVAVNTNQPGQPVTTSNTAVTATPPGMTEYTILKGDSFATIAKKFHVTTKAVQDANPNVEPTKLQINQKIMVPAPAPATTSSVPTTTATGGTITYSVKSGDTLTSIAAKHSTTVSAIRRANSLKTDHLQVDQKLKIPVKAQ